MAVVVESVSAIASGTGTDGNVTINKPSGLAVGDLMVAHLFHESNPAGEWYQLSGWTRIINLYENGEYYSSSIQIKKADAGDVAATNFTFHANSTFNTRWGAIFRISGGVNPADVLFSSSRLRTSHNTSSTTGLTPHAPNSLVMMFVNHDISGSNRVSSFSLATSNPSSWTMAYNTDRMGAAYAIRPEATATGNATVSYTTNTGVSNLAFLIISPPVPASGTAALHTASPTFFSTTGAAGTHGTTTTKTVSPSFFDTSGKASQRSVWVKENKGTTNWTKETR